MKKPSKTTRSNKEMKPSAKRPAVVRESVVALQQAEARPVKRATNLTLDPAAIERGEEFGALHDTSLSKLVTGFLYALPSSKDAIVSELTPAVKRLYGLAAGGSIGREDYREHLHKKYGGK